MLVQVCISVDDTIKEAEEAAWSLVSGQGIRRDPKRILFHFDSF